MTMEMLGGLIYGLLQKGEENGITQSEISQIIGLKKREVRRAIAQLRDDGKVIIASNSGYYLPTDDDAGVVAVRRFIAMMEAQAKSRYLSVKSAERWLAEFNQESFT